MRAVPVPYFSDRGERIVCEVCPVHCALREGEEGVCRGRKVVNGVLVATNYGQVVAEHIDPVEKKPLYHFFPGSTVYSVGPNGCNFHCRWCQNCEISQGSVPTYSLLPDQLAERAVQHSSIGMAYTYTEPLIWYETLRDTMPLVHEVGGKNIIVSNGYIEEAPLQDLLRFIDAANIDLKSLDRSRHMKQTGGDVAVVQHTIQQLLDAGIHLEITHLLVTDFADKAESVDSIASWIASLDRRIPLHLSRYYPRHKASSPATSLEFLEQAWSIASNHLDFVYIGNANLKVGADTVCPSCGETAIRRSGYAAEILFDPGAGCCPSCGADLNVRT
ncbi:AmmeMemoRadiSam system radical SAM enzyme [bacterium]|nr:AmmeMemoRadiSam system radical SAM enzyme [bacterium]